MKILAISGLFPRNYNPYEGIFIYDQIRALADRGNQIHVLVPTPIAPKPLSLFKRWNRYATSKIHHHVHLRATQVRYLRPPGAWFNRYEGLSCYSFIRNRVIGLHKMENYDLIFSNSIIPDGYAAVKLGKELNIPSVCSPTGSDIMVLPKIYKSMLKSSMYCLLNANLVYANSKRLAQETEGLTGNKIKVKIIYRGCSFELFSRSRYSKEKMRQFYGINNEELVFAFTGSIKKQKGMKELAEAFSSIAQINKYAKLSLVGEGPYITQMRELLSSEGISQRVIWHGSVEHSKVAELLALADFFVFPSYSEGMPNALIEAMAMGIPVIATNVGGIPEVVEHEKTGILINPGSVKELEMAMEQFITNKDWAKKLGEMGSLKVRKMMDRSIISHQLQELLESVVIN